MMAPKFGTSILLSFLLVLAFFGLYFHNAPTPKTEASHLSPAKGWAWSPNVGWVSFNCENDTPPCASSNYKVHIEHLAGGVLRVRGWAWSTILGWLSFEPTYLQSCPAGTCEARLSGKELTGWAKVLSTGEWVSLNCANDPSPCVSSDYKVSYDPVTGNLSGWAWGSGFLGWMSFSCNDTGTCGVSPYQVRIESAPEDSCQDITALNFGGPLPCTYSGEIPPPGGGVGGTTTPPSFDFKETIPR